MIKLGDIGRAVEEAVEEQALWVLAWIIAEQDRHQAGLLVRVRKRGPDPAGVWHRLPGGPRYRLSGTLLGKHSPACRERHRSQPQLSVFRKAALSHRSSVSRPYV